MPRQVPSEFNFIEHGATRGLVFHEGAERIGGALFARERCELMLVEGRGAMWTFPWLPGRRGIVRRFKRGGVIRHVIRESYLLRNRPLREFRLHERLMELGLPVPKLLGVCWTRRGCLYSGALATEELPGIDLDGWLRTNREDQEKRRLILHACGELIRKMHDTGVIHGDLQVKNIFICGESPVLLDLDGASIRPALLPVRCECNLLRLRRSFEKRGHGRNLFDILMQGYGEIKFRKWLDHFFALKGGLSDLAFARRSNRK